VFRIWQLKKSPISRLESLLLLSIIEMLPLAFDRSMALECEWIEKMPRMSKFPNVVREWEGFARFPYVLLHVEIFDPLNMCRIFASFGCQ